MSAALTGRSGARPTPSIVPGDIPGIRALLALQVAVVVIAALYFGAEVLIPIVLAVLLSFLLQPLNAFLRRCHLGRVLSVLLSVLLALGLFGGLFWLIGSQLMGLSQQLGADQATIQRKIGELRALTSGGPSAISGFGPLRDQIGHLLAGPPPATGTALGGAPSGPAMPQAVKVVDGPETPMTLLQQVFSRIAHPVATALVVFVVVIFVLLQREDLRDRMIRLFGTKDLHRTTLALDDAGSRLSRYFLTQFAINVSFGALIAGGLFLLGLPSPVLWGILAALLRYVPYFGILLAAVLPTLLGAAAFDGWTHAVLVLSLFVVADQVLGQFMEPMLIGHSTGLSPLSVILAATFWAFLWGPIGLILSTPLTLCAVVLGHHVEQLRFLDVLLGDRPPLSPVESLYQRMLAGDPDEIEDQAETLLEDMPRARYYDEVVTEALRMAAVDHERTVLDHAHLHGMTLALGSLLDELDHRPDRTDLPGGAVAASRAPVLCVPGTFALDPIAARMMLQELAQAGIGAAIAQAGSLARDGQATLETGDAAVLCVCAIGTEQRLSSLRYAVRRLRRQAPGLPIVVAFWPEDEDGTGSSERRIGERARQAIAADATVSGTREMIRYCRS